MKARQAGFEIATHWSPRQFSYQDIFLNRCWNSTHSLLWTGPLYESDLSTARRLPPVQECNCWPCLPSQGPCRNPSRLFEMHVLSWSQSPDANPDKDPLNDFLRGPITFPPWEHNVYLCKLLLDSRVKLCTKCRGIFFQSFISSLSFQEERLPVVKYAVKACNSWPGSEIASHVTCDNLSDPSGFWGLITLNHCAPDRCVRRHEKVDPHFSPPRSGGPQMAPCKQCRLAWGACLFSRGGWRYPTPSPSLLRPSRHTRSPTQGATVGRSIARQSVTGSRILLWSSAGLPKWCWIFKWPAKT